MKKPKKQAAAPVKAPPAPRPVASLHLDDLHPGFEPVAYFDDRIAHHAVVADREGRLFSLEMMTGETCRYAGWNRPRPLTDAEALRQIAALAYTWPVVAPFMNYHDQHLAALLRRAADNLDSSPAIPPGHATVEIRRHDIVVRITAPRAKLDQAGKHAIALIQDEAAAAGN